MSTRVGVLVGLVATVVLAWVILFIIPFPVHAQVPSRTVSWTAPGDDGSVGTATSYAMKWSLTRPDTTSATAKAAWWTGAATFGGMPVPLVAGTRQGATVGPPGGFTTGTNYYLVIRATDDAGNIADWSNVHVINIPDTLPPATIIDFGSAP